MDKKKVVLDSNIINNTGIGNKLFGNRVELEKILNEVQLFVPQIVIDEIVEHKRRTFFNERNMLQRSALFKAVHNNTDDLSAIDGNHFIENDIKSETIDYTVIDIDDCENFIEKFKILAIKNKAPFEEKSDKGFKDALVASSVEKLLKATRVDEKVILATKDQKLVEYFNDNPKVVTTGSLLEILDIATDSSRPRRILVKDASSKEENRKEKIITELLLELKLSPTFQKTHEVIGSLQQYKNLLSEDNCMDIVISTLYNNQISWIAGDPDINDFLKYVYPQCKNKLDVNQRKEFEAIIDISTD